ncbi:hypothetical protein AAC387_Pa05g3710 [Persea americana]
MSERLQGDNARFYKILNVSNTVSEYDLKKAYFYAYMTFRGINREKSRDVALAYEVLSDPKKRKVYDQNGEDALTICGRDPMDLFKSTFEGHPFGLGARKRRGNDAIYPLKVSLEELYNGTLKMRTVSRNVICSRCNGNGLASGDLMTCADCRGEGVMVSGMQNNPHLGQNKLHVCKKCKGTGETIEDNDRCCPRCKGEKVVQGKKVLEVVVAKGSQNGQKITFHGEADEAPDRITGDIVFVVEEEEHAKFKRKGNDLFVEHSLSLIEALWGFQFVSTHLDNRQLLIKSNLGEVVKPDQFKAINDEGMPMYRQTFMRGKLYIRFTVDFPHSLAPLTPDLHKVLETILPPKTSVQLDDMELAKCEEKTMHNVHIGESSTKRARGEQEAHTEDEDRHDGA